MLSCVIPHPARRKLSQRPGRIGGPKGNLIAILPGDASKRTAGAAFRADRGAAPRNETPPSKAGVRPRRKNNKSFNAFANRGLIDSLPLLRRRMEPVDSIPPRQFVGNEHSAICPYCRE